MSKLHLLPSSAESVGESVTVVWNPVSGLAAATCDLCAESADGGYGWAYRWAETHLCDPELVALLAGLDKRAA